MLGVRLGVRLEVRLGVRLGAALESSDAVNAVVQSKKYQNSIDSMLTRMNGGGGRRHTRINNLYIISGASDRRGLTVTF